MRVCSTCITCTILVATYSQGLFLSTFFDVSSWICIDGSLRAPLCGAIFQQDPNEAPFFTPLHPLSFHPPHPSFSPPAFHCEPVGGGRNIHYPLQIQLQAFGDKSSTWLSATAGGGGMYHSPSPNQTFPLPSASVDRFPM